MVQGQQAHLPSLQEDCLELCIRAHYQRFPERHVYERARCRLCAGTVEDASAAWAMPNFCLVAFHAQHKPGLLRIKQSRHRCVGELRF